MSLMMVVVYESLLAVIHCSEPSLLRQLLPRMASQRTLGSFYMKRLIDLVIACSALFFLSPLIVLTALLIRCKLGSPVLFVQTRPGYQGRPFRMYKFRSMLNACNAQGEPLPDEERLTSFGRFLRSSSLDELPELWNVVRGDMSLVGPRPLMMAYLDRYTPEQRRRHDVKPGITGWAQVNGRNALSWDEKFALDLWYVDNHSSALDIRILWLTLWTVLLRRGVAADGHVTMPEFFGSEIEKTAKHE